MAERFLQLSDVAEVLKISASQTYALVRSGELPAIKIGGRGQWRVEAAQLEAYIERCYVETKAFVASHPSALRDDEPAPEEDALGAARHRRADHAPRPSGLRRGSPATG